MEILKVSSKSNPSKVAGALANIFREKGSVEIQTIGAGSLNQAIKAVAIARGFVAPSGKNLVCIPAFQAPLFYFQIPLSASCLMLRITVSYVSGTKSSPSVISS